jgi:hypothetical protein
MANKIFINTVGLTIEINMVNTIVGATSLALNIKKPNGTIVIWVPEIYDSTKLRYLTVAGDLDQAGNYNIQPSFVLGGWSGKGEVVSLSVADLFT